MTAVRKRRRIRLRDFSIVRRQPRRVCVAAQRVQQTSLMAERCAEKRMGQRQIGRKSQHVTAQLRGFVEAPGVHDNRR